MSPNELYLVQTDTTVGFVSADIKKLSNAKQRDINQPFLICVNSYKKLLNQTRVPKIHKKVVRRGAKKSFLYKNSNAIRVVKDRYHSKFLAKFDLIYSTSANINKKKFNLIYALESSQIIIEDYKGFKESPSSNIFKLGKKRIQKLR
jgi:tRNA A37 threonylcarbamoyladenosine synthetase subunit TsaC/SUA5/YrdC